MEMIRRLPRSAVWVLAGLLTCCGALGEPGKEPAGRENIANAGVAPYIKIDVDEDPVNASQPFISLPREPGGLPINCVGGTEPFVLKLGTLYRMWYEDTCPSETGREEKAEGSTCIYTIDSTDGEHWWGRGPGGTPLTITWDEAKSSPYDPGAWEGGKVGAPTILRTPQNPVTPYRMWYAGGDLSGIGYAFSRDGFSWTRSGPSGPEAPAPVLVPCLDWEGGASGRIGSPSVILDDGTFRMWYFGEDDEEGRRIGHATSANGTSWRKMDAAGFLRSEEGRHTEGETCSQGQADLPISPVLSPITIRPCTPQELEQDPFCMDWALGRNWEWTQVWAPHVIRDDSSIRKIYRMYYTGGVLVLRDPDNLPSMINEHSTSVGYAGSWNGVEWEKQRIGINPVLDEPFALDLGGFMEYWCQRIPPQGDNLFCLFKEWMSQLSLRILTNEYAPTVLRDDKEFKMWFRQNDALNMAMPERYEGIGLAANPPRDIF